MFARIKRFFDKKLWTKEQVGDAVVAGAITATQYEEIVGEEYAA